MYSVLLKKSSAYGPLVRQFNLADAFIVNKPTGFAYPRSRCRKLIQDRNIQAKVKTAKNNIEDQLNVPLKISAEL
jgi:hypothetical protein